MPTAQLRPRPSRVAGVREVLHAWFPPGAHAYPPHTHDTWTVLVVDRGTVGYHLHRDEHRTASRAVTLLPPGIPHDGRDATDHGFRKRVLYLEPDALAVEVTRRAATLPTVPVPGVRRRVDRLHGLLAGPAGDDLAAECELALLLDELTTLASDHHRAPDTPRGDRGPAVALRAILDESLTDRPTLTEVAQRLGTSPSTLVRAFTRHVGMPPHQYLLGRRVDAARRLLLDGVPAARVAVEVGFHDQSHLSRHFRRVLGVSPGVFARASRG